MYVFVHYEVVVSDNYKYYRADVDSMVTMSDLKTELKPLMRDVDDELDTVTIHIEMDKDAFKRFMSGNLSKIKCGYPDTYRDDPAYLETFIRFY